jgi:hypothetical protein
MVLGAADVAMSILVSVVFASNPILGAVATIAWGFLKGLLTPPSPSPEQTLYLLIMNEVSSMMNKFEAKLALKDVQSELLAVIDETTWMDSILEERPLCTGFNCNNCSAQCGFKEGYCDKCNSGSGVRGACCKRGSNNNVCKSVPSLNFLHAGDQRQCVLAPSAEKSSTRNLKLVYTLMIQHDIAKIAHKIQNSEYVHDGTEEASDWAYNVLPTALILEQYHYNLLAELVVLDNTYKSGVVKRLQVVATNYDMLFKYTWQKGFDGHKRKFKKTLGWKVTTSLVSLNSKETCRYQHDGTCTVYGKNICEDAGCATDFISYTVPGRRRMFFSCNYSPYGNDTSQRRRIQVRGCIENDMEIEYNKTYVKPYENISRDHRLLMKAVQNRTSENDTAPEKLPMNNSYNVVRSVETSMYCTVSGMPYMRCNTTTIDGSAGFLFKQEGDLWTLQPASTDNYCTVMDKLLQCSSGASAKETFRITNTTPHNTKFTLRTKSGMYCRNYNILGLAHFECDRLQPSGHQSEFEILPS